ncbi:MAG: outer membrane lipoprotein chaperone LolA [Halochromatium sp.]|uniref:outer membrane lipoprotein chaperone LolA n=1 Tax=Halochromatium sp. TaxID=2049430 RepID=UPI00397AE866
MIDRFRQGRSGGQPASHEWAPRPAPALRPSHRIPRLGTTALTCCALILIALWAPMALADGIDELKAYLRGLNSLSADFRQITLGTDGGEMIESSGTFYLLRPNRFRWDYDSPNDQQIVADGSRIYVHDKDLNQVTHSSQKKILDGTPAQLLASEQPVEDYFELRNLDEGDDRTWVELIPKTEDTEVVKLRIAFVDGQLDTLLMEDRFGQLTRFIFDDLERNPQLDYALFRFERPAGSDFLQVD